MEFDELKAVEAMNQALVEAGRKPYDTDEVLNVVDMIWDFYEENGLLDIESDPDDDPDDIEQEVVDYVKRMLRKDKDAVVSPDDASLLVHAEMAYEDSII